MPITCVSRDGAIPEPVQAPPAVALLEVTKVGAVVDVEQRRLPGLEEDVLAALQGLVEQQAGVADVRRQPVGVLHEVLDDRVDGEPAAVVDLGQQLVLQLECVLDLAVQDLLVEEVLDADADPVHLVGVRRADAATGRADAAGAEEALGHLVELPVVVGDDVGARAHLQRGGVDAALLEAVDLGEEDAEIDDDAVADDGRAARCQDARGQQVEGVLLAGAVLLRDDDGVAGVVPAVELDDVVDRAAEQVGRLALPLVAPLGSDDGDRGHLSLLRDGRSPSASRRLLNAPDCSLQHARSPGKTPGSCAQRLMERDG